MLTTRLSFLGLWLPPAQVQGIEGLQQQGSLAADPTLQRSCAQGPSPPPTCRDLRTVPPPPGPFLLSARWVSATSHGPPESASLSVFTWTEEKQSWDVYTGAEQSQKV